MGNRSSSLPPAGSVQFVPALGVRILASIFLAAIVAVILSGVLGPLSVSVAGAVSLLAVLVFVAFTMVLFRKTPEWRAKHDKLIIFRKCRAEASKIAREVAKWNAVGPRR